MKTRQGANQRKYKIVKNDFLKSLAIGGIEAGKTMNKDYDKAVNVLAKIEKHFNLVPKSETKKMLRNRAMMEEIDREIELRHLQIAKQLSKMMLFIKVYDSFKIQIHGNGWSRKTIDTIMGAKGNIVVLTNIKMTKNLFKFFITHNFK
jgi:hypothetical protein